MAVALSVVVLPAFNDLPGVPGEATPWYDAYRPSETIDIDGVDEPLRYTEDGLGIVPTGIGKNAAAATTTALLTSNKLDLSDTLFLTVGVAGGPPSLSIGSVVIASAILDWDDKCRFDYPTEESPIALNPYTDGQGVYHPDGDTVERTLTLTDNVELTTSDSLPQRVSDSPVITPGTNVCGDELWHGSELAAQVEWLVSHSETTDPYRATEMEDAGTAYALSRFDALSQYLCIRGIANYDRPLDSQSPRENFFSDSFESGFAVGLENAVRVARRVVENEL